MTTSDRLKDILRGTLQLGDRADRLSASTRLLGDIPEFDSMAVITIVTAIEEEFGVVFSDDELSAETFETFGSLVSLVESKA